MRYLEAGYYWITKIASNGTIIVDGEKYELKNTTGNLVIVVEQYASYDTSEVKIVKVPRTISIGA